MHQHGGALQKNTLLTPNRSSHPRNYPDRPTPSPKSTAASSPHTQTWREITDREKCGLVSVCANVARYSNPGICSAGLFCGIQIPELTELVCTLSSKTTNPGIFRDLSARQQRSRGITHYPNEYLYQQLGLIRLPMLPQHLRWGEGMMFCPRAGCVSSACPVR
jgi:hypothetical protein